MTKLPLQPIALGEGEPDVQGENGPTRQAACDRVLAPNTQGVRHEQAHPAVGGHHSPGLRNGTNVFYSATTGTCVADYIKINLIWSKAGPDVTMATRSVANVKNVSDSRICNWGLPQNRNLKTDAFTPGSQHKTGTVTVTSYGSNC